MDPVNQASDSYTKWLSVYLTVVDLLCQFDERWYFIERVVDVHTLAHDG
jgi:hypothetical protein